MKLAGILALLLGSIIAIWAIQDYVKNEHDRQYKVDTMMEIMSATGDPSRVEIYLKDIQEDKDNEKFDALIGIGAAVILIAGIAMISHAKSQKIKEVSV